MIRRGRGPIARRLTTPGTVELFAKLPPSTLDMYPSYWDFLRYSLVTLGAEIPFDKGRVRVGGIIYLGEYPRAFTYQVRKKREESKKTILLVT